MLRRQSPKLPKTWLMTDERMGERLIPSIRALPRGSGIVFRHHTLPPKQRRSLFKHIRCIARKNRLMLVFDGTTGAACAVKADGQHSSDQKRPSSIRTMAVHNMAERIKAERIGVDLIFVSPVFRTATHPGQKPLGRVRFGQLVCGSKTPVIALGGMTYRQAKSLRNFEIHGWAAIDGLMR